MLLRFISRHLLPLYRAHPMFFKWNCRQYLFPQNLPHIQRVGVRETSAHRGAAIGASPGNHGHGSGVSFPEHLPLCHREGRRQESPALSTCEPAPDRRLEQSYGRTWGRGCELGDESLCPPSRHSTGHHGGGLWPLSTHSGDSWWGWPHVRLSSGGQALGMDDHWDGKQAPSARKREKEKGTGHIFRPSELETHHTHVWEPSASIAFSLTACAFMTVRNDRSSGHLQKKIRHRRHTV